MTNEALEIEETPLSELDLLKSRADLMGLKYHHKIGVDKLKAKIEAHLSQQGLDDVTDAEVEATPTIKRSKKGAPIEGIPPTSVIYNGKTVSPDKIVDPNLSEHLQLTPTERKNRANKLVRIRIACMNPAKKDWEGEIFSVGSAKLGTYKKYVPFNTEWHVPYIIYETIKERKCTIFKTIRGPRGEKWRRGQQVGEYNVEKLSALSPDDLQELAKLQAMKATPGENESR